MSEESRTGVVRADRGSWWLPWIVALPITFLVLPSLGRLVFLLSGAAPSDAGDAALIRHWTTGFLHMTLGLLMALIVPLQLRASLRRRSPRAHRVMGWVFITAAAVTVGTGMVMNVVMPRVGGLWKVAAIDVMGVGFVVALVLAVRAIRRRDVVMHRAWMARALAFGLAGGTAAIVLFPVFLAFGQPGDTAVALGRWLSVVVNVAVVEVVVLGRAAPRAQVAMG